MNSPRTLLAATLMGGLLFTAASASASVVISELVTDRAGFVAPAPVRIVAPTGIPRRYQSETIRLSLTIDASGRPHDIALLCDRDPALVRRLLPAVAQWQFRPAMQDGRAVPASVVLPLQIVDGPTS